MADRFIDQDETQIYEPYASKNMRARLIGKIAAFDSALHHIADGIDNNITTKLADPKCVVRESTHWHGRFDAMMKALGPVVAFAQDARGDRQSLTPEVEAARLAWLNR